ncbi:zinc knuckle CX2CX4HX4C containing protein [Tanacetum coccineum]
MSMTIQSDVKDKILATPSETSKVENAPAEMLRDLDQQMEKRADDGNIVTDALSRKERVKPRRVRAMAIAIQYGIEMDDLPRGFGRRCRMLLVVTIRFGVLLVSFKAAWDKVNVKLSILYLFLEAWGSLGVLVEVGYSRMSNTSDKGTTFGDGTARVGMQLRSSPKVRVIMLMNSIYLNVDESTFLCDLSFILWTSISQHPRLELRVEVQRINQMLIPTFVPWWLIPYLMVVNISFPRKVVEKVGLEAVLEGGPWMIRNSPIILKKWSMDTRLLKEELTRIPIWDVFTKETTVLSLIGGRPGCDTCKNFWSSSITYCLKKKVVSPPIVTTSNVVTPTVEKTNDGFQTVGKKKKRKVATLMSNSSSKKGTTYVGYTSQSTPMWKTTGNSSKKDNLSMSNSFSALNEEEEEDEEEDVENVYDESANLIQNTKAGGCSSFTAAVG